MGEITVWSLPVTVFHHGLVPLQYFRFRPQTTAGVESEHISIPLYVRRGDLVDTTVQMLEVVRDFMQ